MSGTADATTTPPSEGNTHQAKDEAKDAKCEKGREGGHEGCSQEEELTHTNSKQAELEPAGSEDATIAPEIEEERKGDREDWSQEKGLEHVDLQQAELAEAAANYPTLVEDMSNSNTPQANDTMFEGERKGDREDGLQEKGLEHADLQQAKLAEAAAKYPTLGEDLSHSGHVTETTVTSATSDQDDTAVVERESRRQKRVRVEKKRQMAKFISSVTKMQATWRGVACRNEIMKEFDKAMQEEEEDNRAKHAREAFRAEMIKQLKGHFQMLDKDGSGTVDFEEFYAHVQEVVRHKKESTSGAAGDAFYLSRSDARKIFAYADADGSGNIDSGEELVKAMFCLNKAFQEMAVWGVLERQQIQLRCVIKLQSAARGFRARRAYRKKQLAREEDGRAGGGKPMPMPGTRVGETGMYQRGSKVYLFEVTPGSGEYRALTAGVREVVWRRDRARTMRRETAAVFARNAGVDPAALRAAAEVLDRRREKREREKLIKRVGVVHTQRASSKFGQEQDMTSEEVKERSRQKWETRRCGTLPFSASCLSFLYQ